MMRSRRPSLRVFRHDHPHIGNELDGPDQLPLQRPIGRLIRNRNRGSKASRERKHRLFSRMACRPSCKNDRLGPWEMVAQLDGDQCRHGVRLVGIRSEVHLLQELGNELQGLGHPWRIAKIENAEAFAAVVVSLLREGGI